MSAIQRYLSGSSSRSTFTLRGQGQQGRWWLAATKLFNRQLHRLPYSNKCCRLCTFDPVVPTLSGRKYTQPQLSSSIVGHNSYCNWFRTFATPPAALQRQDNEPRSSSNDSIRAGSSLLPSSTASGTTTTSHDDGTHLIRLSKRMSELDICSRRQADKFIMQGRVMLNGSPVEPILGQKVSPLEENIVLMSQSYYQDGASSSSNIKSMAVVQRRPREFAWEELQTSAIVLHKPTGYLSGVFDGPASSASGPTLPRPPSNQPTLEQQHVPAVRLLTPDNACIVPSNYYDDLDHCVNEAEYQEANNIVNHRLDFRLHRASNLTTLQHYVPAGRLDMNSSGLLVLTKQGGVLAKKLISPDGLIEKEYLLIVEPIQGLTRYEREAGMSEERLPKPNKNLLKFKRGGHVLWGEERRPPLRPVVAAEWLRWNTTNGGGGGDSRNDLLMQNFVSPDIDLRPNERRRILRVVLKEGRKHQVRRMCREILGMHVVKLVRTRIGPIELDSLPEGKWRPLRQHEAEAIFTAS